MTWLLLAEQVGFAYPQDHRGVMPVSFALNRGESLLIYGQSGSGKSTLARCLAGLIPHLYHGEMNGKVWINDRSSTEMQLWELTEQVGLVFQNPALQMLAPTVDEEILFGLENLGLPPEEMQKRLDKAIWQFDLQPFHIRSPHSLSGGEQQKLALAAVMARNPDVLVLDEPLSMLDSTSAIEFVNYLQRLVEDGLTLVICEHREQFLQSIPQLARLKLNSVPVPDDVRPVMVSAYPQTCAPFEISVQQLSVTLAKNKVLNDLSFNLSSGQVVALVGRNGTGKTTLLRALAGLQRFKGIISVQDKDGNKTPQFNMIFQNPDTQLFNPTVREEILYKIPDINPDLYEWLLDALDLKRYENTPPLLLSEGEKRRVALATALMHPSKNGVLLDEPSLGQDRTHKEILVQLLRTMAQAGWLVLFSTHDLELAAQSDQIILLTKQGIVRYGDTQIILQDNAAWEQVGLLRPAWMNLSCSD